jgi:hypothetical protein
MSDRDRRDLSLPPLPARLEQQDEVDEQETSSGGLAAAARAVGKAFGFLRWRKGSEPDTEPRSARVVAKPRPAKPAKPLKK